MSDALHIELRQQAPIALDITLSIGVGEVVALVGPSGAGKTTLLRAIAGLHHGPTGRVACGDVAWLDSAAGVNLPAHRRPVGMLFQTYALFPHRTAAANVAEALLHLPSAQRMARAVQLLDQVHLPGLADRMPHQLSGGQQQRVALARALAREPDVLLLDEPFSAVDQPVRRALHRLLGDLRRVSSVPILLVTHDVDDAARIADRICLMQAGRIVEQGAPAALLGNPQSRLMRWLETGE